MKHIFPSALLRCMPKKHILRIHKNNIRRVVNMWNWKWFAVIPKKKTKKRKIKLIFFTNLKIANKSFDVNVHQWVVPSFLCSTFIVCDWIWRLQYYIYVILWEYEIFSHDFYSSFYGKNSLLNCILFDWIRIRAFDSSNTHIYISIQTFRLFFLSFLSHHSQNENVENSKHIVLIN